MPSAASVGPAGMNASVSVDGLVASQSLSASETSTETVVKLPAVGSCTVTVVGAWYVWPVIATSVGIGSAPSVGLLLAGNACVSPFRENRPPPTGGAAAISTRATQRSIRFGVAGFLNVFCTRYRNVPEKVEWAPFVVRSLTTGVMSNATNPSQRF